VGTGSKASAGTRGGTSGKQSGTAPRTEAVSDAATLCLRPKPHGQKRRTRVEKQPGTGTALPLLVQTRARAVSDRLKRTTAVDRATCCRPSRHRAGAPGASRAPHELRLPSARPKPCAAASGNAQVGLGRVSRRPGPCVAPRAGSCRDDDRRQGVRWAAPPPPLALTGARDPCSQAFAEDGRRGPQYCAAAEDPAWPALHAPSPATAPQDGCGAATAGGPSAPQSRQDLRPTIDSAASLADGPKAKNRSAGDVWLLTKGVLIRVGPAPARDCALGPPPVRCPAEHLLHHITASSNFTSLRTPWWPAKGSHSTAAAPTARFRY
jgi:hypothetical protein